MTFQKKQSFYFWVVYTNLSSGDLTVHTSLHPEVQATDRHSWDGYEYLFVIQDIWTHLGVKSKFPAWFSKNWSSIEKLSTAWQIAPKHVVRASGYKGQLADVTCIQGIKHDVCSLVGLFLVLGNMIQIRGLTSTIQQKALSLIADMVSVTSWPDGLPILPDVILEVESDGKVSLQQLFAKVAPAVKACIKTRPFPSKIIQLGALMYHSNYPKLKSVFATLDLPIPFWVSMQLP